MTLEINNDTLMFKLEMFSLQTLLVLSCFKITKCQSKQNLSKSYITVQNCGVNKIIINLSFGLNCLKVAAKTFIRLKNIAF